MKYTTVEILPGVVLTHCVEDRFKTQCLSISLLTGLNADSASICAILPRVLFRESKVHGTMQEILSSCESSYGMHVSPVVRKKGEVISLGFYGDCICPDFLPDGENQLPYMTELLCDLLLNPQTSGGQLKKEYVDSEKQKLLEDIQARAEDKDSYAYYRAIHEMCTFENYGIDELGEEDSLDSFNYLDLTKFYRQLLSECPIELFYCGPVSVEEVASELKFHLLSLPRENLNYEMETDIRMNSVEAGPRSVFDYLPAEQTRLIVGYRLGECMLSPDLPSILVFNTLFGNGTESELFRKLRTEDALCYDITSSADCIKGILTVQTGIEYRDRDRVLQAIRNVLAKIKSGNFTEQQLEVAARCLSQSILQVSEDPALLEDYHLTALLEETDYMPEELAAACQQVTKLGIRDVASSLQEDMIYIMAPEECEN